MAKELLTEVKIGKFLSFIMGAIMGGKTDTITSKVSDDKELVKRIKETDKSYKEMMKYVKSKYGKEYMKNLDARTVQLMKKKGFDV